MNEPAAEPVKIAPWLAEVELYEREANDFVERGKKILKRYKDERGPQGDQQRRFNALWANVQTLQPALYARNPKPDIQRRFKDEDPLGRVASMVLERSVAYFCDADSFGRTVRQSVLDYLLPGRGTVWVRYEPVIETGEAQLSDDTEQGEESDAGEVVEFEKVIPDYVHWEDFGHNVCRTPEEMSMMWRRVYMTRAALKERFGDEKGALVPLDYTPKDLKGGALDQLEHRGVIYELWDKERNCAVWFNKNVPEALDYRDDPLGLEGFFPAPVPLLATVANDSLLPVADYAEYQDQAQELDSITGRIASIERSLKVVGVYDASVAGVERMLAQGVENQLIPVEAWAVFAEKGGIDGVVDFLPLKEIVEALTALYEVRAQVKADLQEITGLSDIIRGYSNPNETATAQEIKSQYGSMRLKDRQADVQRFVRGIVRIMVDIICGHFSMDTIKRISGIRLFTQAEKQQIQGLIAQAQAAGQPLPQPPNGMTADQVETMLRDPSWEEVEALLRDKPMRSFRIDIETDSTIKADEEAEKQSRVEFLKVLGDFMSKAVEAGAAQPALAPFLAQAVMFGVRAFPVGKELEGSLQTALTKIEKQASQPQAQKPDPEMEKVKADSQIRQMQIQADQQAAQSKMQAEMALEAQRAKIEEGRAASEMQIETQKAQAEIALEREKAKIQGEIELQKAHIQADAAIEVARINAAKDDGAAAEAREARAAQGEAQKQFSDASAKQWEAISQALGQIQQQSQIMPEVLAALHASMKAQGEAHQQQMARMEQSSAASQGMVMNALSEMVKSLGAEKELVRGDDGRALGIRQKQMAN